MPKQRKIYTFLVGLPHTYLWESSVFTQNILQVKETPVWVSKYVAILWDASHIVRVCAWAHTHPIFNFDHTRQPGWFPLHLLNYTSWCLVMFCSLLNREAGRRENKRGKWYWFRFQLESDAFDPMNGANTFRGDLVIDHGSCELNTANATAVPCCLFAHCTDHK